MPNGETNDSRWDRLSLEGDPHILLGKRVKGDIEAVRIDVHENFFAELRYVCEMAVIKVGETEERMYEPSAALEVGEQHFALTSKEIGDFLNPVMDSSGHPEQSDRLGQVGDAEEGQKREAALFECLRDPILHRHATTREFNGFGPFFYALCWQQEDMSWAAFVRKTNPQQFFKTGRVWCQYSTTLKKLDTQPTFALDPSIDLIVHDGHVVSFSGSALNFLFTDVRLAQSGVPAQIESIRQAIGTAITLSDKSLQSLIAAGKRLKSEANRIYGLSARLAELQALDALTVERYREIAGDDPAALSLIDAYDTLDFDEAGAHVFLDVIEGRYFQDDWTGSPRRADRFSRRAT